MVNVEQEIIVKHLRKSRDLSKHVLKITNSYGSALISHQFRITSFIDDRIEMITVIDFLPVVRIYKEGENKIVDNEDLLNEDPENVAT